MSLPCERIRLPSMSVNIGTELHLKHNLDVLLRLFAPSFSGVSLPYHTVDLHWSWTLTYIPGKSTSRQLSDIRSFSDPRPRRGRGRQSTGHGTRRRPLMRSSLGQRHLHAPGARHIRHRRMAKTCFVSALTTRPSPRSKLVGFWRCLSKSGNSTSAGKSRSH